MSSRPPTQIAKRKQIIVGASILAGVLGLATVGVVLTDKGDAKSSATLKKDVKTKSYIAPGEKVEPQDAWRGVADDRLTLMESNMRKLESENRTLSEQVKSGKGTPAASAQGPTKAGDTTAVKAPEAMSDDDLDKRLKEYEKTTKAPAGYPPNTPSNPISGSPQPVS